MHPEVEEFVSKNNIKNWNSLIISMLEDLKQAFPHKNLEWCIWVLMKYLKPQIIIRDTDRDVECYLEMDVVKKITPIVDKYPLATPEEKTALAMEAVATAVKNEMREEMYVEFVKLKKAITQQLLLRSRQENRSGATPTPHILTWEERKQCFKGAVLRVMVLKYKHGDLIFTKNTHWMAVYRFAVDTEIMYDDTDPNVPEDSSTPQYKKFADFAHELQLDVNPPTRLPFKHNSIKGMNNKPNYIRYNAVRPWSMDGLVDNTTGCILNEKGYTLYQELNSIYKSILLAYVRRCNRAAQTQD